MTKIKNSVSSSRRKSRKAHFGAPSSVRRVKPDPVGRDAIFGVVSDAGCFVRCVDVLR